MDLIDRQAALSEVHKSFYEFFDICEDDEETTITPKDAQLLEINKVITIRIKNLPTSEPEIIRCKDCAYYDSDWCNVWSNTTRYDGYCHESEPYKGE